MQVLELNLASFLRLKDSRLFSIDTRGCLHALSDFSNCTPGISVAVSLKLQGKICQEAETRANGESKF